MKRSRRGGRRPQNGQSGHSGGGIGGGSGGGGYNPNRTYDSNGPEVKIRGTASHVYEKYLQLARDANVSGDRVMAENYLQHAEHYFRIMGAIQAQFQQSQPPAAPATAAAPGTGGQPQLGAVPATPAGTEGQPFVEEQTLQGSAVSFSLSEDMAGDDDGDDEGDDEEDAPENEEVQAG